MNAYHFTILLRDAVYQDDLEDKLFAAGLDDALLYSKNKAVCLIFDREAESAKQAVETAMAQIRKAGFTDLILQETGYIANFQSLLKLMSIESVMPSNLLILCCPLFLPPSIFPSIRVFSNESVLRIR